MNRMLTRCKLTNSNRWIPVSALLLGLAWASPHAAAQEEGYVDEVPAVEETTTEGEGAEVATEPVNPAEQALAEYADELALLQQGRQAAADHHHSLGRRMMEEGRLPQAIEQLKFAVDYFPNNEEFRRSLRDAETLAGASRDQRSTFIDQLSDELRVEHQRLWVEIEQHLDRARTLLEEGSYNQSEQALDMAATRLQHLPYADEKRAPKMREVESLLQIVRERRAQQELSDASEANRNSADQARDLRRYELRLERERIDMLLRRALKARERRDFDECILVCEQILKIRPNEGRASALLVTARRERHVYVRQITADKWDEEHRLLSQQQQASLLPQLDLVVYPDDWAEIDRRRRPPTRGLDSEAEESWRQDILRNFEQEMTLEFQDSDIQDVVNFFRARTEINFVLDPEVLISGSVPPINLKVDAVPVKDALEFVMELAGLKYSLQNEAVFISTEEGLQGKTEMRIYDIRDLTLGLTQFPGPELTIPEPGGTGSQLIPEIEDQDPPSLDELMEIIQIVVDPESWDADGVGLEEYNGSMVITQTPEIHEKVESLLAQLRRQRGVQINLKVRFLQVENGMLEEIGFEWGDYSSNNPATPAPADASNDGAGNFDFGGYVASTAGTPAAAAGTVRTPLVDYFSQSSLDVDGGNEGLQLNTRIFKDANGFLGNVLFSAVEKTRRGNILIQPDVTLFSGQRAHLVRMNQQAYIADYEVSGGQYDPIISIISYGTVLDLEAVASADRRYITVTMRPSKAEVELWRTFGASTQLGGAESENNGAGIGFNPFLGTNLPIFIPEMSYQTVRTTSTIPDGGSLLVAGLNRSNSSRSHSGVPFLSHIPFLGRLFSSNGRSEQELKDFIYLEGHIVLFEEIEERL